AVEPRGDLADIVVEPAKARDLAVVDDGAVPDQPYLRAARDLAVSHVRAGDRTDAGGTEELAHLGAAERFLDLFWREHPLHRAAQILDRAIDDRVVTDLDALALGGRAGVPDRSDVERHDH